MNWPDGIDQEFVDWCDRQEFEDKRQKQKVILQEWLKFWLEVFWAMVFFLILAFGFALIQLILSLPAWRH